MRSCCLVTVKANQKAKIPKPKNQKYQSQKTKTKKNKFKRNNFRDSWRSLIGIPESSGKLFFVVLFFLFCYFGFSTVRVFDFSCILVYALGNTLYCTPSLLAVQLGDLRQGEKG